MRYIRQSFLPARTWRSLEDLNAQADAWCAGTSSDRRWPEDTTLTVRDAFVQEQPLLLALPEHRYVTEERVHVPVHKTPYIRYDLNDYSVPAAHVRSTVTVMASLDTVRVLDGAQEVARHQRSWDKGQQIEDPAHIAALVLAKQQASREQGQNRLRVAVPSSSELLRQAAERGLPLRSLVRALQRLLDEYGASELEHACVEALARGVPHDNAVRQSLERRREQRQLPPPLALALPDDVRARNLTVRTPSLEAYDRIALSHPASLATDHTTDETFDDNTPDPHP